MPKGILFLKSELNMVVGVPAKLRMCGWCQLILVIYCGVILTVSLVPALSRKFFFILPVNQYNRR